MPHARTCGSLNTSSRLLMGPAGMPCSIINGVHSIRVFRFRLASSSSLSTCLFCMRSAFEIKRESVVSSSSSRMEHSLLHMACVAGAKFNGPSAVRSEEPTSELHSLMRISYAVFCLKKKHKTLTYQHYHTILN